MKIVARFAKSIYEGEKMTYTDTEFTNTEEETPLTTLTPEDVEPPRETGHVKWFNDVRSYGFIEREGKDDVFVHATNINDEPQTLKENDLVEFTLVQTDKGLSAENVTVVREDPNF